MRLVTPNCQRLPIGNSWIVDKDGDSPSEDGSKQDDAWTQPVCNSGSVGESGVETVWLVRLTECQASNSSASLRLSLNHCCDLESPLPVLFEFATTTPQLSHPLPAGPSVDTSSQRCRADMLLPTA